MYMYVEIVGYVWVQIPPLISGINGEVRMTIPLTDINWSMSGEIR